MLDNLANCYPDEAVVLAIGDTDTWRDTRRRFPAINEAIFMEFHELDAEIFKFLAPDIVISPLVAPGFDCLDLAQFLAQHCFTGVYRVVTFKLPAPQIILQEIRTICSSADVNLCEVLANNDSGTTH